jgi:hypothetical protein
VLILAVLLYVAGAYAIAAPDPWTLAVTRGSAGGVRAGVRAAADRYRPLSGPSADPVPDPQKTGVRSKGTPVRRTRPGSKGTGPDRGSAKTLWDRVRSAGRTGVRLLRAAVPGVRAVRPGYRKAAKKALKKRYGKAPVPVPATSVNAPDDQPTAKEETPMNIDVPTDGPAEYIGPNDITEDNEILSMLSQALIDAQQAFIEHVSGMVSKYEAANWSTDPMTEVMSSLSEVGETGWTDALEVVPVIESAIESAIILGSSIETEGAKGDTTAFVAS